ncbi:MAG: putative Zinc finger protein 474 [Streblomastix strix]|uniref:Putative Zinc finger protein 474 n=1 Tax=Streblomastix strix TaxID=222440 RepID=A0A5J4WJ07_9EUKA|nr:MAG: putative Zinc finger protein 474 [Streblomastix strix]
MPDCLKKWDTAQQVLPAKYRKKPPNAPTVPMPSSIRDVAAVEAWNMAAYQVSQDARNPCPWCGRQFNADALAGHLNSCPKRQEGGAPGGGGGMQSKPRFLMCYICGREFGTTSLQIHQKQCMEKFKAEQAKLPPGQRKPLPKPPQEFLGGGGAIKGGGKIGQSQMDAMNEAAYDSYIDNLSPCPNCGRKFAADRLPIHLKSCKPGHVLTPLSTKAQQGKQATSGAGAKGANASPSHGYTQYDEDDGGDYQEPEEPKPVARSVPKGGAKAAAPKTKAAAPRAAPAAGGGGAYGYNLASLPPDALGFGEDIELVECGRCGRKFAADRISKHENVCKGPIEVKAHSNDLPPPPTAQELKKIEKKPAKWKQQHEALMAGIKAGRQLAQFQKEGRPLSELPPPPPPEEHPDYILCNYCGRRYAPDTYARHAPGCAQRQNRPPPPPKRQQAYPPPQVKSKAVPKKAAGRR